ncbi:MAG: hypothetical protein IGR90_06260 [Synechococcales cyanobacterium K32_A2020_035]|nr:hypothetical protein [Synechococcales cyanobacterium K32_A2020_035]
MISFFAGHCFFFRIIDIKGHVEGNLDEYSQQETMRNNQRFVLAVFAAICFITLPTSCRSTDAVTESASPTDEQTTTETIDPFQVAVDQAMEAAESAQTAETTYDWEGVAMAWQEAIDLMASVPADNTNYSIAQQKVTEYQPNLEYAQTRQEALRPPEAPEQVSLSGGGLGDQLAVFTSKLGSNAGTPTAGRFLNDSILADFPEYAGGRATSVIAQLELSQRGYLSKADAEDRTARMTPDDSVLIESSSEDLGTFISEKRWYESPTLANALHSFYSQTGDPNPGRFVVIFDYEAQSPERILSIQIFAGSNPN